MKKGSLALAVSLAALLILLLPASSLAGPISFSGQFDPSLASVSTGGGDGWFDPSGAPLSVTVWGSDSNLEQGVYTVVSWSVASASPTSFLWSYETWDEGPFYDPAGYYLNGNYFQLTNNGGPLYQSGATSVSLSPGDLFGFYVWTTDDCCGRAALTISSVPEPATAALGGIGLLALALVARRRGK